MRRQVCRRLVVIPTPVGPLRQVSLDSISKVRAKFRAPRIPKTADTTSSPCTRMPLSTTSNADGASSPECFDSVTPCGRMRPSVEIGEAEDVGEGNKRGRGAIRRREDPTGEDPTPTGEDPTRGRPDPRTIDRPVQRVVTPRRLGPGRIRISNSNLWRDNDSATSWPQRACRVRARHRWVAASEPHRVARRRYRSRPSDRHWLPPGNTHRERGPRGTAPMPLAIVETDRAASGERNWPPSCLYCRTAAPALCDRHVRS